MAVKETFEIDSNPTPEEEEGEFLNPDEKRKKLQNDQLEQQKELRKEYATKSWWLAVAWTGFSALMTLLQFCKPWGKHLEQAEFVAIVATALATVIALYIQVGKGIFSK